MRGVGVGAASCARPGCKNKVEATAPSAQPPSYCGAVCARWDAGFSSCLSSRGVLPGLALFLLSLVTALSCTKDPSRQVCARRVLAPTHARTDVARKTEGNICPYMYTGELPNRPASLPRQAPEAFGVKAAPGLRSGTGSPMC